MRLKKSPKPQFTTLTQDEWVAKELAAIDYGFAKVNKNKQTRIAFLQRIGLLDKNGKPTYDTDD